MDTDNSGQKKKELDNSRILTLKHGRLTISSSVKKRYLRINKAHYRWQKKKSINKLSSSSHEDTVSYLNIRKLAKVHTFDGFHFPPKFLGVLAFSCGIHISFKRSIFKNKIGQTSEK